MYGSAEHRSIVTDDSCTAARTGLILKLISVTREHQILAEPWREGVQSRHRSIELQKKDREGRRLDGALARCDRVCGILSRPRNLTEQQA